MKISLLFLSTLLFTKFSFAQQSAISGDSLGKYSYQIFTVNLKKAAIDFGTCFFIKKSDALYLVTARHVLIGCDTITNKQRYLYDDVYVFIPNTPQSMIPVYFTKPSDTCSCLEVNKDTDLAIIKMDARLIPYVNSVEDFILPLFKKMGDVEIYGQGFNSRGDTIMRLTNPHHIHLPAKSFNVIYVNDKNNKIDSLPYYFAVTTLKIDNKIKGYSGSPVFLQDYKTKAWRLTGVLIGGLQAANPQKTKTRDCFIVAKPEFIINRINENNCGLR